MDGLAASLLALDALSALLGLLVAGFFVRAWRLSADPAHLLFAVGLALVASSFLTVTASEFDLGGTGGMWDRVRLVGQTGGAVVVLLTYVAVARQERAKPILILGGAAAIMSIAIGALYFVVPPAGVLPSAQVTFGTAHLIQALAWGAIAILAGRNWWRNPRGINFLVPAGYGAFAISKYTWFIVDFTDDTRLAFLVYPWRLCALMLLLVALLPRAPEAGLASP